VVKLAHDLNFLQDVCSLRNMVSVWMGKTRWEWQLEWEWMAAALEDELK